MRNPYRPILTKIEKITIENEAKDLKTFRLAFLEEEGLNGFQYE